VLADAVTRGFDRALVLGDIVGYGPNPNETIDRVRALNPLAVVRGNHDKVAIDIRQADGFHAAARAAAHWMRDSLTPDNLQWLASLPQGPVAVDGSIEICHGAPFDEDAYVFDEIDAWQAVSRLTHAIGFYGHTHVAVVFRHAKQSLTVLNQTDGTFSVQLDADATYLINPGSVGQPRDHDPRAAYALYDTDTRRLDLMRVAYPFELTQKKMTQAGLPDPLIRRLASGR
jgi:diadenosine tetraphosphatase ApaH/serine/threonine PP2A family protein phosphatase